MLHSLRTVQAFLDDNAGKLAGVVNTGTRQKLVDTIAVLSVHASDQTGSHLASQGATHKQRALREALLRDHMAPISRIGRADLPQTPEVEALRMPRGRPTPERLAAAAYGMAKAATPFAALFISAGLPANFVLQLEAATDAMLISLNDRTQSRGKRTGTTIGLRAQLRDGRKLVHVLDAFVKSALKDDPALLANWNAVRKVQKVTGRPSAAPAPASTPATPTS